MIGVKQGGVAVTLLPDVVNRPTGEDSQIQHTMEGQLFRLAGPLLAGMPPDFCRDVYPASVIPLRQTKAKTLGIGIVSVTAINVAVIFSYKDRLVL